ncbi:MAG: RNA polymerase sigma factor [Bacteroidales bacterium]|jgi:RNA polymerase sigma-70 factor (ECF subfamily)|nr:RNA polymerase sigma factor [Bacteroidales bacterium]
MDRRDDTYFIRQVLNGNINSYAALVDRHKDRVFNLAFRITGNREEAEEVAQDAFLKAYRSLGSFRMNSLFSTWLYKIVYNTAVSFIRTRKKTILSLDEFPASIKDFENENPDEIKAEKEYRDYLVNFAMQKLSEDERAVISLYYYEELSSEEISFITGISRNNVKVRLFRARKRMAEIIKKEEKRNMIYHE